MSKEELKDFASRDTPENINIPQGWNALIIWAVGRFGIGILLSIVLGYSTVTVYNDSRMDRIQLMDAYEKSTQTMTEVIRTLDELNRRIERIER